MELRHVLGFIGDSDLVLCYNGPNCFFSNGLIFVDRYLIRTPNCDDQILGLCYDLDTTDLAILPLSTSPPSCPPGYALQLDGCHNVSPPCQPTAVQIGSYCFQFPTV